MLYSKRNAPLSLMLCTCLGLSVSAGTNPLKKTVSFPDLTKPKVEFLENKGQLRDLNNQPAPYLLFKAECAGVDLYITNKGLSYVFLKTEEEEDEKKELPPEKGEVFKVEYEKVEVELIGATIKKENIVKLEESEAYFNYHGYENRMSYCQVKKYGKIVVKNVYPGIDWILYNTDKSGFKYDFLVHSGANSDQIKLLYVSKSPLQIKEAGSISINVFCGKLDESAPYTYAAKSGKAITSRFKKLSQVSKVGMSRTLLSFGLDNAVVQKEDIIIDPQLNWATSFSSSAGDGTFCIDADKNGNIYLCGYGASTNFPLLNAGTYYSTSPMGGYISKFSNNGTLLWSTYFAGANGTTFLETDNNGNLFLCGTASNASLPTVNNGTYFQGASAGGQDTYIAKFDSAGNLLWCTYYGGSGAENSPTVTTDINGNVFLTGITSSTNFPLQNAGTYFEPTITGSSSGFVVKFDNSGNRLWATYIKGIGQSSTDTDRMGNLLIGSQASTVIPLLNPGGPAYYQGIGSMPGTEACILKFSNTGVLLWGTYYGGSGPDRITSLVTDKYNNVFLTGTTTSTNFPLQNAGTFFNPVKANNLEPFILKFDNTCTRKWATFIGGSRNDNFSEFDNIATDTCGNLYLGLTTNSRNLPFQVACDGGYFDNSIDTSVTTTGNNVFLAKFSNSGIITWSSYFGGDNDSHRAVLATDEFGNMFAAGEWYTTGSGLSYPFVNAGGTTFFSNTPLGAHDIYIAKFNSGTPLTQSFSYAGPYCPSDTAQPALVPPGFLMGGVLSSVSGLSINPTSGKIYPSASTPGTYTVNYLTNSSCACSATIAGSTSTATLTIIAAPSLTVTGTKTLCIGQKMTYSVSGASSYTWNNGAVSPTLTATPGTTATLNFTVTANTAQGCLAKNSFSVSVINCTGLNDFLTATSRIYVYPNPGKGEVNVVSENDVTLILSNQLGQVLKTIVLNGNNLRQEKITGLVPGIYFLHDQRQSQTAFKVIVSD